MLSLNFSYDHNSVRLLLDGLPDLSKGQSNNTLGILSSWKIQILGFPELEGKLEHLESLMQVNSKYSRYIISGVKKKISSSKNNISLSFSKKGHLLQLVSSKKGVPPLNIILDDAQFCDLTRCLDELRNDARVRIDWDINPDLPIKRYNFKIDLYFYKKFLLSTIGLLVLLCSSFLISLIPMGKDYEENLDKTTTNRYFELNNNEKNRYDL